jgi:sulfite exporter TauE/SafE
MVKLLAIVAIGFLLGLRHATDPDHVIAVSTIVTREQKVSRASLIGLAWGVGHTLTILVVGSVLILFRVALPPRVGLAMELAVGVMLIVLGIHNLRATFTWIPKLLPWRKPAVHYHAHGDYVHAHATPQHEHPHNPEQTPLVAIDQRLGRSGLYSSVRPLVVGIVHGLAGSAAIALLILSTIGRAGWAVAYLLVFGLGTILGMMVITVAMASTFSYGQKRFLRIGQHFGLAAGVVSLVFGVFVTYEMAFVFGLFSAHPTWIPR